MTFDHHRIADADYFAENRMAAHSDHRWFADTDELAVGVSSFEQCLNGLWKFRLAATPAEVVAGFEQPEFDCSGWGEVRVPGHLQLEGHGHPQYVNVQYPWDGHEQVEPGQVPTRRNPVGCYRTSFTVDEPLPEGESLAVCFNGAESSIAVWLNGNWVGYSADSFTPAEFDLTPHLVAGENILAAQVFSYSAGSWLEDQDFFRFSGLFRDVVLLRRPRTHLQDLRVHVALDDGLDRGSLQVTARLQGDGSVRASLLGVGDLTPAGDASRLAVELERPRLWSPEDPHLYTLQLEVFDADGVPTEVVQQAVGVRRFAIEDGVMKLNGQRIVFRGVNRHEFGLRGRVVSRERTEADIVLLKQNNVNAVRTSHYPNSTWFYDLCDRHGLMVIDEMNLETHGMWDRLWRQGLGVEEAFPGDRPQWRAALVDRADSMLERDKNHPSIVMWSCGNESFGGSNLLAVADRFRELDDRPVHYEGVDHDPRLPDTTDVVSRMYTPAADIEDFLRSHRDKPFIVCEYAHAMGNSFGAVEKYLQLAEREPLFQGGFIWDFADQALPLVDRHGQAFLGYGGDFGDQPNDLDFCGNGILFADHSPSPKLAEVKYLYQGLSIEVGRDAFTVRNVMLATNTSAYRCHVVLAREGRELRRERVACEVAPGEQGRTALPFTLPQAAGEYSIDVIFTLAGDTSWAPAGHEVAHEQGVFRVGDARPTAPAPAARCPVTAPELVRGIHNVGVRTEHVEALFSTLHGGLVSYRHGGRELLSGMPRVNYWHAPTSNERGWQMGFHDGGWLLASQYPRLLDGVAAPAVEVLDGGGPGGAGTVRLTFVHELPTSPVSRCTTSWTVDGTGRLEVELVLQPGDGLGDPPEFGLLLPTLPEFSTLRWYGEGPHESYVDRRGSARLGVWQARVADQLTRYLRPQEAGNHTGVRWASVTDERGRGLLLDAPATMDFSALPWAPTEVENAAHHTELPPVHRTVLRPALMRRGVGGDDSWGARTHPEFCLPAGEELRFTVCLRPL